MLGLPQKFKNDIANTHQTGLSPILVIGWDMDTNTPSSDAIFLGQNKEIFDGHQVEDYDLKISTLKESIAMDTRKFKINNIS